MTSSFTRPVAWEGPIEDVGDNIASHQFGYPDDRCNRCDAKPWHVAATYPCGAEVPREKVFVNEDGSISHIERITR